ncbi:hypothetical protein [Candidatus Methylomirabilis limnetica]|uniref:hypothetical protein n=1 Tax=Candidatus Methylomirabilis limnetica TaxID=2033718 RepID=UPI003D770B08
MLLAISSAVSQCDVSPKGATSDFVLVLDPTHLVGSYRSGNNRIDGMTNVLKNPHVGMILLVPGRGDMLRVNAASPSSATRRSWRAWPCMASSPRSRSASRLRRRTCTIPRSSSIRRIIRVELRSIGTLMTGGGNVRRRRLVGIQWIKVLRPGYGLWLAPFMSPPSQRRGSSNSRC